MRGKLLLGGAVLCGVCLFAVTGQGAGVEGVPSTAFLAGGPMNDPDAPIRTGRWGENLALPADTPPSPPPIETLAPAPTHEALVERRALAPTPPPSLRQAAFQPAPRRTSRRLETRTDAEAIPALPLSAPPSTDRGLDARRLLVRIGPAPEDRRKGRWFLFAAGSGEAFGLNLIRDPMRGWRQSGWSVERLAEYGKAQIGVGWRRDNKQVALSAARRETGAFGVSREDTVVGVTFTVSGQPGQKVRREQRLPKR